MTRSQANIRAKALLKSIDNLQFKLYSFGDDLDSLGSKTISDLPDEAAFEFDISRMKMQELIDLLSTRPK